MKISFGIYQLIKNIALTTTFALSILSGCAFAGVLDDLKTLQKGIKTITADFNQVKTTELFGRPIKSSGRFYFKSPVGVRWEYEDSVTVIYDGKTLYMFYPDLDVAEEIDGAQGYAGPLVFNLDFILKEYQVDSEWTEQGITLTLNPIKPMHFEAIRLFYIKGNAFPAHIEVNEKNGDKTKIIFKNVKINIEVPDGLLRFSPPPGVIIKKRDMLE